MREWVPLCNFFSFPFTNNKWFPNVFIMLYSLPTTIKLQWSYILNHKTLLLSTFYRNVEYKVLLKTLQMQKFHNHLNAKCTNSSSKEPSKFKSSGKWAIIYNFQQISNWNWWWSQTNFMLGLIHSQYLISDFTSTVWKLEKVQKVKQKENIHIICASAIWSRFLNPFPAEFISKLWKIGSN
jgi:hypothetical protein